MDEAREALSLAIVNARGKSAKPYIAMADFARVIDNTDLEIRSLRQALWFDRTNEEIEARLEGLGLIPGPSLAIRPESRILTLSGSHSMLYPYFRIIGYEDESQGHHLEPEHR